MTSDIGEEIKRKLVHLLTLIYVVGYWVLPRNITLMGLSLAILFALIIDIMRLRSKKISHILLKMGIVYRKSEENNFSGLIWTLLGAFFTMYFFEFPPREITRDIVLVSLLYSVFGDAAAALVGSIFGKIKIGSKSVEGSLACLAVNLLVGYFFLPWPIWFFGGIAATLYEAIQWPLNDNFWMPILSAGTITLLMMRFAFLY